MSTSTDLVRQALASLAVLARRATQGAPARLNNVPADLQDRAEVPNFPGVRFRFPSGLEQLIQEAVASIPREQAHLAAQGHTGPLPPAPYLAISGGGDKGAFATGLLAGWTAAGTRPQFKVVTGVS